jgi:hypothetical protein
VKFGRSAQLPRSCCLNLLPWRRRQKAYPKRWYLVLSTKLHDVTSHITRWRTLPARGNLTIVIHPASQVRTYLSPGVPRPVINYRRSTLGEALCHCRVTSAMSSLETRYWFTFSSLHWSHDDKKSVHMNTHAWRPGRLKDQTLNLASVVGFIPWIGLLCTIFRPLDILLGSAASGGFCKKYPHSSPLDFMFGRRFPPVSNVLQRTSRSSW